MVALFSTYFDPSFSTNKIETLCSDIIARTYGQDNLTAKAIVTCGPIAIFQKNHEVGTDDWSAEGEPFVFAARVEQAVDSKQRIYYFKNDYDNYFKAGTSWTSSGGTYYWSVNVEKIQVTGIGKTAGWEEFSVHEYIPGGRTQT